MGIAVQSINKAMVNKMQFMPTKITKTSAIHAIGIKNASNTVGGATKKSQNEQNSIIVRDNERRAGSTSERGSLERRSKSRKDKRSGSEGSFSRPGNLPKYGTEQKNKNKAKILSSFTHDDANENNSLNDELQKTNQD